MPRRNASRSSHISINNSKINNFQEKWFYGFDTPIKINPSYNIPSPIIANGLLIIPDPNMERLLALNLSNGKKKWQTDRICTNLTYASSPVFTCTNLLLARSKIIQQIDLDFGELTYFANDGIELLDILSTPLIYDEWIFFPLSNGIYIYDWQIEKGNFISNISDAQDPIIFKDKVMILSKSGESLLFEPSIISTKNERKTLIENAVCSAPCVSGEMIYFEVYHKRKRKICAYNPTDEHLVITDFENERCKKDHLHFNFPPLAYKDGVIVASDTYPRLYYARCVGDEMDIIPIDIEIKVGPIQIRRISHIFSIIIGTYFISKYQNGFFYLNLEDSKVKGMEFFGFDDEVLIQPIANQNQLFFLCRNGVQCYSFN